MQVWGSSASRLNGVKQVEIVSTTEPTEHCPVPNGFSYHTITAYSDASVSTQAIGTGENVTSSDTLSSTDNTFYFMNEPGMEKLGSTLSLEQYKEKGGAYLPAGWVPLAVKIDNNQDPLTYNPIGGTVNPGVNIGTQAFVSGTAAQAINISATSTPFPENLLIGGDLGGEPNKDVGAVPLGGYSSINAGAGGGDNMWGTASRGIPQRRYSEDRPLTGTLISRTTTSPIPVGPGGYNATGQVRLTLLCTSVSGTSDRNP